MRPPRWLSILGIGLFLGVALLPIVLLVGLPLFPGKVPTEAAQSPGFQVRHLTVGFNTVTVALATAACALLLGAPLALLLHKSDMPGRSIMGAVYLLPMLIPPYMHALVWSQMEGFAPYLAPVPMHGLAGAIWVLTLAHFPFVTLLTLAGLRSVDRSLEEASLLHRGPRQTLGRIVLPLALPHIAAGAIFVVIFALMDFAVPDLLRVQVYPVEIFVQYSAFFDERAAAVLSCPLIACAVLLLFLQNRLMHGRAYVNAGAGFSGSRPYPLGWVRWPACIACSLLLMCAAAVPLGLLAVRAGGPVDLVRTVRDASEQLVYSLGIAGSAAAATVCLAFLLACRIRSGGWVSRWLPMAIFVPFAVPSVTLGIGLIRVWNRPLVEVCYESSVVVVMGCVARFLPFAYVALHAGLRQVDPHLEEAAWLATPSWVRVVRKILWPLLRPSVLCGFFIVFLLAFGELGTTLLVIPPGKETLPIKIYNLMHYGAERAVAGISLFVVVLVMAGAGLLWAVSRKTQPLR